MLLNRKAIIAFILRHRSRRQLVNTASHVPAGVLIALELGAQSAASGLAARAAGALGDSLLLRGKVKKNLAAEPLESFIDAAARPRTGPIVGNPTTKGRGLALAPLLNDRFVLEAPLLGLREQGVRLVGDEDEG